MERAKGTEKYMERRSESRAWVLVSLDALRPIDATRTASVPQGAF